MPFFSPGRSRLLFLLLFLLRLPLPACFCPLFLQEVPAAAQQEAIPHNAGQNISELLAQAQAAEMRKDWRSASEYYEQALMLAQKQTPDSLQLASICGDLAYAEHQQEQWAKAEKYSQQALAIFRKANDTERVMVTLNNLGEVTQRQGKFSESRKCYEEALPYYETHYPDTPATAIILYNLAQGVQQMDDSKQAEYYARKALAIWQKRAPGSLNIGACLSSLGAIAARQGEWTTAKEDFKRALAIEEPLASVSMQAADQASTDYIALTMVAAVEGDVQTAQEDCAHALTIIHKMAPASPKEIQIQFLLSMLNRIPGEGEAADSPSPQALAVVKSYFPNPLDKATVLDMQSMAAVSRSQWEEARKYALESLTIREKQRPGSLYVMTSRQVLGYLAQKQGDLTGAQQHFEKALAITRAIAPESPSNALPLGCLGNVLLAQHQSGKALPYLSQATVLIERQRQQISVPESRALLLEQYADPFTALMEAQVALGHNEDAFATLERTRARSLVEMLNTRDAKTRFAEGADVPADLRQQQHELDKQRSRQMRRWYTHPGVNETKRIQAEIRQIDSQQRELEAAIYRASPRYASLQYPQPLAFAQAQRTLDEGTLLLAYALCEKQCYLFALTRTSLKVHVLPAQKAALEENVRQLLQVMTPAQGNYQQAARQLYHDLIEPARGEINAAKRLLICPDGVLHTLPFAALVTSEPTRPLQRLIEIKPLHTVVSLGLYRQLRAAFVSQPVSQSGTILALADPDPPSFGPPAPANGAAKLTAKTAQQLPLPPLPQTRQQIAMLKQLYGNRVRAWEGGQATLSLFRKECPQANIIHLACHGIANAADPFASALALSPDGKEDKDGGWLTAYDILGLRLRADLVMLSACDTGLGKPTEFEGIQGLTRALQYAGARSVGASLWSVKVDSTTALMQQFYRQRQAGKSKDVALQQAQIALLHDRSHPDWQHPYYWAAFQIVGDWR